MRIALRELRRRPGHFLFVGIATTVLTVLLLVLGGLLDGLLLGSTGAIRAQDAPVFVYSSDAQESFLRSRITADQRAAIEAVDGVTGTAGLGITLEAGRRDGSDQLLDVAVLGYERPTAVLPDPPAPGQAWADSRLRAEGVGEGDRVLVGASEVPLTVAGFVDDTSYLLQAGLWVDLPTWHEIQGASRPDAVIAADSVQVLLVDGTGSPAALAGKVDSALGGSVTALTRDEALVSLPGTQEQNATFSALIGTTFFVVGLITALFFVLLAVERASLYAAMKALGVTTSRLLEWSATQALIVAASAFVLGAAFAALMAATLPASFPFQLQSGRMVATLVILLVTATVGSLVPVRRIARIDPAEAIS